MSERAVNLGHLIIGKEATPGVAVTPNIATPYYKESMLTDMGLVEDNPVVGQKFKAYQALQGQRSHKGGVTVLAEPNTAAHWLNMLLTKGTTTGAGPYTHPFTLSNTADPKTYTIDFSTVSQVIRFFGVQASKLSPTLNGNEVQFQIELSALGSFYGRQIATVTGSGPYTVTFDTTYDPAPNTGLVVGDLIRFTNAAGTTVIDATVASLVGTTQITTSTNVSTMVAGDMVTLRPQTPTYALVTPFLKARTEARFAVDAATALTAAQTRLDDLSWTVEHMFLNDGGEPRWGGFDPASLIRTQGDVSVKVKKFFDTPEEMQRYISVVKRALVIRHFSETGYELRITVNNMKIKGNPKPQSETGGVFYSELEYITSYDSTDAQGMDVKVINNLASV